MTERAASAPPDASPSAASPLAGPAPPAATTPAVVAATWQSRPPEGAWVPDAIAAQLPWTRAMAYRDVDRAQATVATSSQGVWQLLGVSQRGRVHAHDGTHREDAMAIEWGTHGFLLAAADGAGSSRYSRVAAAVVCRQLALAAPSLLRDGLPSGAPASWEPLMRLTLAQAIGAACNELCSAAGGADLATRDFRTTALAVMAVDNLVAAVQVGDGAIVTVAGDGRITRLGTGDSGCYSGEVSAFVPEVDAAAIEARVVVAALEGVEGVLVLTDGIEDPFYPIERRGTEMARQLYHGVSEPAEGFRVQATHGPIVGSPHALERLAQWMAFERRGENDDRTLAGAFRRPGTIDR